MFNWLRKKTPPAEAALHCDVHSHLLPGLDDGVQSFEQAETIITRFHHMGYNRLITTPHIISDLYRNTPETILGKLEELRQYLKDKNIPVTIDAAAEYYLDDALFNMLRQNTPLLTFGPKKYLLFETTFLNEPLNLKEFIFQATAQGYTLVLAHPERYSFIQNSIAKAEDLLGAWRIVPDKHKLYNRLLLQGGTDHGKPSHRKRMGTPAGQRLPPLCSTPSWLKKPCA